MLREAGWCCICKEFFPYRFKVWSNHVESHSSKEQVQIFKREQKPSNAVARKKLHLEARRQQEVVPAKRDTNLAAQFQPAQDEPQGNSESQGKSESCSESSSESSNQSSSESETDYQWAYDAVLQRLSQELSSHWGEEPRGTLGDPRDSYTRQRLNRPGQLNRLHLLFLDPVISTASSSSGI